jgi:hypothetical protein
VRCAITSIRVSAKPTSANAALWQAYIFAIGDAGRIGQTRRRRGGRLRNSPVPELCIAYRLMRAGAGDLAAIGTSSQQARVSC